MEFIWNELLFRPLLNLLIGLYNTVGLENLGLAIIWLTVIIRLVLLPLSIQDKESEQKKADLEKALAEVGRMFANNPAVLREEQKALFKKYRFRRWKYVTVLAVQGLVLVILYQVFISGTSIENIIDHLYSFLTVPVEINTVFLGIDIAQRSFLLSFLCAALLFVNIVFEHYQDFKSWRKAWEKQDLLFLFGFPLATFIILFILPSVKALFIITTMLFTHVLTLLVTFWRRVKEQEALVKKNAAEKKRLHNESVPHPRDRFQ